MSLTVCRNHTPCSSPTLQKLQARMASQLLSVKEAGMYFPTVTQIGSKTVSANPKAMLFKFVPITSLLNVTVKRDPNWLNQEPAGGVFIVTGPQLISKGKWPKTILHLRLHFTHIPNCTIRKIEWAGAPAVASEQQPATLNSGVFPDSPPVPVRSTKLRKYVDTDEVLTELYVTLAEKLHRLAVQLVADANGVESIKITCTSSTATDDLDTPLVRNLVAKVSEVWEINSMEGWKDGVPKFDESRVLFEVDTAPRKQVVMVIGVDEKPSKEALKKIDEIPACFP
ncbi:hypothetical protein Tco_1505170 [Tanacetum coccineum]